MATFELLPGVIKYAFRDIIRVRLENGELQPFYKSTGVNSKRPGVWLPFDSISLFSHFRKSRYSHGIDADGDKLNTDHPLHRYGSEELKAISEALADIEIPDGFELEGPPYVNLWLATPLSFKELNDLRNADFLPSDWDEYKLLQSIEYRQREMPQRSARLMRDMAKQNHGVDLATEEEAAKYMALHAENIINKAS